MFVTNYLQDTMWNNSIKTHKIQCFLSPILMSNYFVKVKVKDYPFMNLLDFKIHHIPQWWPNYWMGIIH